MDISINCSMLVGNSTESRNLAWCQSLYNFLVAFDACSLAKWMCASKLWASLLHWPHSSMYDLRLASTSEASHM